MKMNKIALFLSIGILSGINIQALLVKAEKSALEIAVQEGNVDRVISIIDHTAGNLFLEARIQNAMQYSASYGQPNIASILLQRYPFASTQRVLILFLSEAARHDNLELVKFALAHGANINGGDVWSTPPLIEAAVRGKTQIVKYLIEHGADLNVSSAIYGGLSLAATLRADHLETAWVILTTIHPQEIQRLKTAIASIRYANPPLVRDVRNVITLKLIQVFTQEHMDYAHKLLDEADAPSKMYRSPEFDREWPTLKQSIAHIKEPQSWNALSKEVEYNFRRAIAAKPKNNPLSDQPLTANIEQNDAIKAFEDWKKKETALMHIDEVD